MELSPNPVSNEIEILIKNWNPTSLKISITDISGKMIQTFNKPVQLGLIRMDVRGLPIGFYYLTLSDGKVSISKKFTKI